jgi:hypothetical protein
MSPTVKVRPGANDEETIPATTKWTRTREVGKMRRARITVPRADANAVTLNEKEDDIELVGVDTLRLVDIETGGSTVTLVCFSYEWLANAVAPTDGGTVREGSDADLVNGWINDVPQWTAGAVTQQAIGLSFVFNHAAPHEGLRRVEKNVPGELQFRDTGTVDYVGRLGADKTGSVTLSSANQNIEDEISITKRGRELDGTHIRLLGAHEGEAQFFANLVPSDDSATYENRVNYSTSRWSDGDTRDWDRFVNKDVTDQPTIEAEAAELGTEITERLVEAKATTTLALNVGDTVQVTKSDADLDRAMRVHRIKEVSEGGTTTRDLLLSTRTIVRSDDSEDLRDIQRFNSGFQGSSVVVQGGGSRQPVDATNNAEIPFFYPDLEFENKAELFVRGLNYRHYSTPNKHDHDVTINGDTQVNTAPSDVATEVTEVANYTSSSSWDTVDTVSTNATVSEVHASITAAPEFGESVADFNTVQIRLKDDDTGDFYPSSAGVQNFYYGNETSAFPISAPGDVTDISVQMKDADAPNDWRVFYGILWFGRHSHTFDSVETTNTAAGVTPGIEETTDTPTGVDVKVDGTTVAADIGTGTFQTTVDISGDLTKNAWNLIELTSDDLGHIQATVSIKGYDKIGSN